MKRCRIQLLFSGILFLTSLAGSQEQQKKPEPLKGPSFTAAVYTVLVDVIATIKDKHISDLRPEEFVIYENGVKQTIDAVEIQSESGARIIKTNAIQPAETAAPVAPRVNFITFLLDYTTTEFQNQKYVRDGVVQYVNEKLGPNDVVAVFATAAGGSLRTLQPFTSDKKRLIASLSGGDVSGSAYAGERALLNSQLSTVGDIASVDTSTAASQAGGSGHTPASAASGAATGSAAGAAMIAQRVENAYLAMRSYMETMLAYPMIAAIKSIALAERDIPGRKTLVLFSEGFEIPRNVEEVMRDAVATANKSNLAIYSVDTAGLYTKDKGTKNELDSINANLGRRRTAVSGGLSEFDHAAEVGSDRKESTLRHLSISTGGALIRNTNDFEGVLERVDEDIRTYYILSYRPTNSEFDGKWREIKVEVTRPGVRVRARSGYYAHPPSDTLLMPEQRALFAAARQRKTAPALPLFVKSAGLFPGADEPAAVVTVEILTDSLKFKENGGAVFDDSLQITGLVSDAAGNAITTFGRPLPLQFNKAQLEAARGGFVTHTESLSLDKGHYNLEVLVYEPSTGSFGYHSSELILDPPAGFGLSDLILSKQVVKVSPESKSDPLVTGAAKILPSASCSFRNGERLIFYFDIYNAKPAGRRSNVNVTLSMIWNGKPLSVKLPSYNVADSLTATSQRIQVSKFLELAGLPVGSYSLKVTAKDLNSGNTSSTEAGFAVVN
jgi:VWFA-related protein